MISNLRNIVQHIALATTPVQALELIVARVRRELAVDMCSIYQWQGSNKHLARAASEAAAGTDGWRAAELEREIVEQVRERREPVAIQDVRLHALQSNGAPSKSGLRVVFAVPIVHFGRVLGVLIVSHCSARPFTEHEQDLLFTIGAQLSGVVSHALAGDQIRRLRDGESSDLAYLQGVAGAPGVAIGTGFVLAHFADLDAIPDREAEDVEAELARLEQAIDAARDELSAACKRWAGSVPEEVHSLFHVYAMLLEGEGLRPDSLELVRAGDWAPGALRKTIDRYAGQFAQMDDEYLQARAEDIREIGRRVLVHLQGGEGDLEYPDHCVLVANEIGFGQITKVPAQKLAGIVSRRGSVLSHTAVMARALGVPAIMGLADLPLTRLHGCRMVVDGFLGRVYVEPTGAILREYRALLAKEDDFAKQVEKFRNMPAITTDERPVDVFIKAGLLAEVSSMDTAKVDGVGLYRTEFAFIVRDSFPGEEEQLRIYRRVLESFAPRPVTMRTLDAGGDKPLPYFSFAEDNPFLGWRGIRMSLDHPEIFLTQLRAMLRANAAVGNLRIMFPLITSVDEVEQAIGQLQEADADLRASGLPSRPCPVGVMVEVPSAVYQAEALAEKVDFLSVGSNDLTQYLLAVDRDNARVANRFDSLHPAVIRAISEVVTRGHEKGKPVGICGEMAGDPVAVVLLLGMGIDDMSTSFARVPIVKWIIRSFSHRDARELLDRALQAPSAAVIRRLVEHALNERGLGQLVTAGTQEEKPPILSP